MMGMLHAENTQGGAAVRSFDRRIDAQARQRARTVPQAAQDERRMEARDSAGATLNWPMPGATVLNRELPVVVEKRLETQSLPRSNARLESKALPSSRKEAPKSARPPGATLNWRVKSALAAGKTDCSGDRMEER